MKKVALVTGASSGIGYATCVRLLKLGYEVYGISRRSIVPKGAISLCADVTDEQAVYEAVKKIMDKEGRIDILINNAGFGISGPIEYTKISDVRDQMDVNFMGELICAQAVLPIMRSQGSGAIVFVSSVAGELAIPYQAFYSTSKAAVHMMALALRNEVKDFGIQVSSIMPGDAKTGFTAERRKDSSGDQVYTKNVAAVEAMEKDEQNGMSADDVAAVIVKAATAKAPKPYYVVGGKYKFFHALYKLTTGKFIYNLVHSMYS
ncbi:MAG: SDR family oxidoreductase [Eubacterium sp.]|nr:SDR family oxidoreductase [Eubacterium sp.]